MIINPEILEDTYKCKKDIAMYLLYNCLLPSIGFDDKYYYYQKSDELVQCLKKMPLNLKIKALFTKLNQVSIFRERR